MKNVLQIAELSYSMLSAPSLAKIGLKVWFESSSASVFIKNVDLSLPFCIVDRIP